MKEPRQTQREPVPPAQASATFRRIHDGPHDGALMKELQAILNQKDCGGEITIHKFASDGSLYFVESMRLDSPKEEVDAFRRKHELIEWENEL